MVMKSFGSYKAFVADIDGTLTEKGENLQPHTREALIRLHDMGLEIGLATGRPLDHRITGRSAEWGLGFPFDFLIGMNGGELWDTYTDTVQREHMLGVQELKEICGFMLEMDVNGIIFAKGYDLVKATRSDPQLDDSIQRNHSTIVYVSPEELCVEPACKIEFHYDPAIEAAVEAAANAHPDPRWIAVRTFPGTIEFMDPRVNKRNALLQYCRHRGIELQDVIACGDMESDIEMMKGAGFGICLKNGSPAAREAADAVTDLPVNEDGLGIYLLSHM